MFVPVDCSECRKPFQVPEATIGKATVCPWCQATVLALPVGAPAQPVPMPLPAEEKPAAPAERPQPAKTSAPQTPAPEPLSLEDAPPAKPLPPEKPPRAKRPRRGWFRWWVVPLAVFALLITALTTIALLRYKQGYLTSMEWQKYTAPDNSCTIDLLGRPSEDITTSPGERRYFSQGWYSGVVTWVGWRDLNQTQIQLARTKDAWNEKLLTKLFDDERERLQSTFGGAITRDATTQFNDPLKNEVLTHEVRLSLPQGVLIERIYVVPDSTRPRVYFVGVAGKIDPDGADAQRLFGSFRVNE
jgi:hypothetical protein